MTVYIPPWYDLGDRFRIKFMAELAVVKLLMLG
jgi:hypothetical protein